MNYLLCFLATIIVVSITVQSQELTFSTEREKLKMCILDHLSKAPSLNINKTGEKLAELVAKRFSFKSFTEKQFSKATDSMFYFIRDNKYSLFSNYEVPEDLRLSIREALENCVERKSLPRFNDEPGELADFLDFVLVDWPVQLNEMVASHEGRSTLRLYAYATGVRLMSALRYFAMDLTVFYRELRRIWILRAEQYYDGRGDEVSYIRHRFTTDRDRMYSSIALEDIHTVDDIDSFVPRRSENFQFRNPILDRWSKNQVFNILESGSSRPRNGSSSSISSTEFYLETHIIQAYRIIMFILEMQLRGISTDRDDIYNGTIPYEVVPFYIQRIVSNDVAYRKYLVASREHFQQFSSEKVQEFFSREDLIMLLSLLNVQRNSKTIPSSATTSTTTTTTTTELPDYGKESKKGGVRDRDCKKYFLPKKRFRLNYEQDRQLGQTNENVDHYGYIIHHGDTKRSKKLDQTIFSRILDGLNPFSFKEYPATNGTFTS